MKISVLYEDKNVLALNKPAGLMVHSDGRTKEPTLTDWILKKYPKLKNVGEPIGEILRPGIVHRLDKETSGVLVVAKNQKTYQFLKEKFQNREVKKTYIALVWGKVKNDKGRIDVSIARSKSDFRQWSAQRGKRGKEREAITEYKVLKRFEVRSLLTVGKEAPYLTLLEVSPKTGRTHQIRVHMKYLNHPVVCDSLYAPLRPCPVLDLKRLGLHAKSIEFKLPTGKKIKIEAPIPTDLKKISLPAGRQVAGEETL